MEALAHPGPDCEDEAASCPMVKNQLLPGLRSFCSVMKGKYYHILISTSCHMNSSTSTRMILIVCEEVCNEGNLFDDGTTFMKNRDLDQIKEMSKVGDEVRALEERVRSWSKRLTEILKESEQIRRENDSSGPQNELEYWKKRGAQFAQIVDQVNSREVQMTVLCLKLARSKVVKEWSDTDKKITFCYNEAKDNAKFIQALEKNCHSLYLDDPVSR